MKKYKQLDNEEIQKWAHKVSAPEDKIYVLDTSYFSFLNGFRADYSLYVDNHTHPLQMLVYDKTGKQYSFFNGVWADAGLYNFTWNTNHQLDRFPPVTGSPIDTMFTFQQHLKYLRTLDGKMVDESQFSGADYNIVIHYTRFTGRQSKKLIKEVKKNQALNKNYKVNYLYVNSDNFYMDRSTY